MHTGWPGGEEAPCPMMACPLCGMVAVPKMPSSGLLHMVASPESSSEQQIFQGKAVQ